MHHIFASDHHDGTVARFVGDGKGVKREIVMLLLVAVLLCYFVAASLKLSL